MTIETAQREPEVGRANTSQRRIDALVAAYIHELSPRHRAERETGTPEARRPRGAASRRRPGTDLS
jgi:hypothetical protein